MKIPRWIVKCIPNIILDPMRPIIGRLIGNIYYSRHFYEEEYHSKGYCLHHCTLGILMKRFEEAGQKAKLYEVLDKINDLPKFKTWLEAGCQFGKSTFWISERYPSTVFYMFDFAEKAVNFIRKHNPIPERSVVWQGNITNVCYGNTKFDNFFDIVSLLDITEHLPKNVYYKAIYEIFRVLKPSGFLLLKQGNEILPEHINIRWEWQLIRDFKRGGFV
ncbi:MAG: class I SAM-dependent methyltransferase, partial [Candidatus Hodarchaeota archaeon]